ncbi:MAG TPA: hypothetical protein PKE54_23335 [Candidatus Obscuribacter sp.]|nr:hypothetical protein [Candidatus Obscuribacter sp.]
MFQQLKNQLLSGQISFNQALPQALPELRGKIADEKLLWLASELQGYENAVAYYQTEDHGLPKYRIVAGGLRYMTPDGQITELKHPYAKRDHIFLSSPISWLEEFASYPGDQSLVEVPELTAFIGAGGGGVICQCQKSELRRIIATFRNEFIAILDKVGETSAP